jgi:hypothetical protein
MHKRALKIDASYLAPWMRAHYFRLLSERFKISDSKADADYVLVSVNQHSYRTDPTYIDNHFLTASRDKIRIFLQHEATSFDLALFDYAVVFTDHIEVDDRVFVTDFFNAGYAGTVGADAFEILCRPVDNPREELKRKTRFCDFIYSHARGAPEREYIFRLLSVYKRVDSYGKLFNNDPPRGTVLETEQGRPSWFHESVALKSSSKFSVAFENAIHPKGYYISEKIVASMLAQTIPIYWGNPRIGERFNPKSFINCHDYQNLKEVAKVVQEIDNDDDRWCSIASEPRMTASQYEKHVSNKEDLKKFLFHIFDQPIPEARRRARGFWVNRYESTKCQCLYASELFWQYQHLILPEIVKGEFLNAVSERLPLNELLELVQRCRAYYRLMDRTSRKRFFDPAYNERADIAKMFVDSEHSDVEMSKLAYAFYGSNKDKGIVANRKFSRHCLQQLEARGVFIDKESCPPLANLVWGRMHLEGEAGVAQDFEEARACFDALVRGDVAWLRNRGQYSIALLSLKSGDIAAAIDGFARMLKLGSLRDSQLGLLDQILRSRIDHVTLREEVSKGLRSFSCVLNREFWRELRNSESNQELLARLEQIETTFGQYELFR